MRILVVAPQPFFTPRGTPFSVYYRTLVMAEHGVSIDLLTYGQGEDVDIPNTRIIRIPSFRFLGSVKTGPSLLKLFLDGFLVLWTVGLLLRHRYDVVHAHEEAVFFCLPLKRLFRFKLLYDMHSSLPQQLTNFDVPRSGLLKKVFGWLEDRSIASADAIVTICPDLSDYVRERIGEDERHLLIENSIFDSVRLVNADTETRGAGGAPEEDLIPENAALVIYAGTFESYQGLDLLLEGFATVVQQRPDARLLMLGGTADQVGHYRDMARQLDIDEFVIFTGRVEPDVARSLNLKADVLTSPRSIGTNTPLKVYEQLASGKPLVATRIYSHTQVLNDEVSFLVEPTAGGIAAGILEVLNNPDEAARRGGAARALYDSQYARGAYTEKIRRLLAHLAADSKS